MKLLKKIAYLLAIVATMVAAPGAHANDVDEPLIMTLKTNVYGYQGPSNSFTIYFGSTEKDVEIFVEGPLSEEYVFVDPYTVGTDSDGEKSVIATAVTLSVTATDNTIKIYGDDSKIDYIDVHGTYAGEINLLGDFVNLSVIDLSHNELSSIDLSPYANLNSIDLTDNLFTDPSKMKIGTNHPSLMILSVGINEVIDPELNLTNFPALQYFSARNNFGLTEVDPSKCPDLVSLVLEVTNVSRLDVSKNLKLDVLNISQTKITNIDISKNVALGEFYASHEGSYNNEVEYKLHSVDVSKNPNLEYLDLSGNLLTELDLTHNPNLVMLLLQRNRLTSLDLSNCTRLANVNLSFNGFDFSNLPLPGEGWSYIYLFNPIECNLKYKVNEPIDLSSKVIRAPYQDTNGNTITPQTYAIVYGVPRAQDEYEIDDKLYTYSDGVITFKEAIADSVYVRFYCSAFEDFDIQTTKFMVKTAEEFDLPSLAFSFNPTAEMAGKEVGLKIGGAPRTSDFTLPEDVILMIGDRTITFEDVLTTSDMPSQNNVTFTMPSTITSSTQVKVYVNDGYTVTALGTDGIKMSGIDLSRSEFITRLEILNAGLTSIDLGYNGELTSLNLSGNALKGLDLTAVRGDYEKWELTDVNLSNNQLTSLTAVAYDVIKKLDLSGNAFTQFDASYYVSLTNFSIRDNQITGTLDLSKSENLKSLDVSGNNISGISVAAWSKLVDINLSDNNLTFATLPVITSSSVNYTYAPQKKMQILTVASAINLSAQNVKSNGSNGTEYVWKYTDTGAPVDKNLLTDEGGAFKFDSSLVGKKIYCEMTNPLFPLFNSQPLTTTETEVSEKPTTLVASFTTTQNGTAQIGFQFNTQGDNAVYIDWRGDGTEYEPYIYEANATGSLYRTGTTYAGKTAKVYTFGKATDISGFFMNVTPLSMFDGSPMTNVGAIDIHNAGLSDDQLILPESTGLYELVLDGNKLSKKTFENYPSLSSLNLAGNAYTSIDLSIYPEVTFAQLASNKISEVKFGENSALYQIDLTSNNISEIDFTGQNNLMEILLDDNNLKTIDLSPVKAKLRALHIAGNNFTFATLPLATDLGPDFFDYKYANQKPIVAPADGNKIDLSEQATVGGTSTVYRWFLGNNNSDVYYDEYLEMFVGEELEGPDVSSDPEYIVENGVTTFIYQPSRKVICAMTNTELPNLILYTSPSAVTVSGVEDVFVNEDGIVEIYNLNGVCIRHASSFEEAVQDIAPGIYIINGKKILIK